MRFRIHLTTPELTRQFHEKLDKAMPPSNLLKVTHAKGKTKAEKTAGAEAFLFLAQALETQARTLRYVLSLKGARLIGARDYGVLVDIPIQGVDPDGETSLAWLKPYTITPEPNDPPSKTEPGPQGWH